MLGSLDILSTPWIFSQVVPLTTAEVVEQAKRRGLDLDAKALRVLCRSGYLAPLVEVTGRRVCEPMVLPAHPHALVSTTGELYRAMGAGRVRDPGLAPFRSRMRFDSRRSSDSRGWWNGLLYSRWQLLDVSLLRELGRGRGPTGRGGTPTAETDRFGVASRRRWALVLSALDARYYPVVDPGFLRLSNTARDEWERFCADFDPIALSARLAVGKAELEDEAERLLAAAKAVDPLGPWSDLVRRAPIKSRDLLRGDALVAFDRRLAAEILLQFAEDLARRETSVAATRSSTRESERDSGRLTGGRDITLDEVLLDLGVSPHPGVVLVVEGETEEILVPRVFDHLRFDRTPDRVRILCMRGADNELALVAAATAAPLLGARIGDTYDLIRPPTRLLVAVDQDLNWDTASKVEKRRATMVNAIRKVLAAQGVPAHVDDLNELVHVRTWPARCFEFAHFTDIELARALRQVHRTCGGLGPEQLAGKIAKVRARKGDIKEVWDNTWGRKPTKPDLARALWPTLRDNIDDARWDETLSMPPGSRGRPRSPHARRRKPTQPVRPACRRQRRPRVKIGSSVVRLPAMS